MAALGDDNGSQSNKAAATAADTEQDSTAATDDTTDLSRLTAGGMTSLLAVLEGGLPGITTDRLDQLKVEAKGDADIDAVAGSIIFPTIIRNSTTGQGEPLALSLP